MSGASLASDVQLAHVHIAVSSKALLESISVPDVTVAPSVLTAPAPFRSYYAAVGDEADQGAESGNGAIRSTQHYCHHSNCPEPPAVCG